MERELSPALAKRLAAYAASAGITLALAPESGAQVVYHDFEPDIFLDLNVNPDKGYLLDFDDDGDTDLRMSLYAYNGGCGLGRGYENSLYFDGFLRDGSVLTYNSQQIATRLSSGDEIGPGLQFSFAAIAAEYDCYYGKPNFPFAGEEGFLGFRLQAGDGQYRYGWLRLAATQLVDQATAFEYAYEATPDTPILAGTRSAALLDGDVNQTTFPATGGTLTYTVTVENTTNQPLPLDLWLDADGPAAFTRRLGSGTLPPGATVTRIIHVQVPAAAPSGDYDVRFKLGHFGSRRFITFERYAVTKEEGAGPTPAGSAEAFAVAPVEGDLFAGAEATPAFVGTHALSAPSPNPAEGQVALTLEVTEAQHVSVTVHDALGRAVAALHDGTMAAGESHRLVFDGSDLPSGVYVVQAVGERFTDTRVVSLVR